MGFSTIRQIVNITSWSTFSVGISLNCVLLLLILHHTPKPMQIYSRILMQTCLTDILLLFATIFAEPITFTTAKGNGRWLNGLVQIENPDNRIFGFIAYITWVFLVYVSLFTYVVQFIYRYLVLNKSKTISLCKYLAMFLAILVIPLVYCTMIGWSYYPVNGKEFLDDPDIAEILGLNFSQKIVVASQTTGGWLVTANFYFILIACTFSYILICVLGWRMHKFIKNRPTVGGNSITSSSRQQQDKINEMNRQITKNLIIQACLPFTIYGPLLFLLVTLMFGVNVKLLPWIQYYYMLSIDPMFFPPALNPIVTILTIRHYRKVFIKTIYLLARLLCCQYPTTAMDSVNTFSSTNPNQNNNNKRNDEQKQQTQPNRNGWTCTH